MIKKNLLLLFGLLTIQNSFSQIDLDITDPWLKDDCTDCGVFHKNLAFKWRKWEYDLIKYTANYYDDFQSEFYYYPDPNPAIVIPFKITANNCIHYLNNSPIDRKYFYNKLAMKVVLNGQPNLDLKLNRNGLLSIIFDQIPRRGLDPRFFKKGCLFTQYHTLGYRVDTRTPDQVKIDGGLFPDRASPINIYHNEMNSDDDSTLVRANSIGYHYKYGKSHTFVSSTISYKYAKRIQWFFQQSYDWYIYEFRYPCVAVNYFIKLREAEVLTTGIPWDHIIGWRRSVGGIVGSYSFNPDYKGHPGYIPAGSNANNIFPTKPKAPKYGIDCYTKEEFEATFSIYNEPIGINVDPQGGITK